ncbi:MAG: hypothetical protein ACTJFN_08210, partial [Sphingobacterium sp.]
TLIFEALSSREEIRHMLPITESNFDYFVSRGNSHQVNPFKNHFGVGRKHEIADHCRVISIRVLELCAKFIMAEGVSGHE